MNLENPFGFKITVEKEKQRIIFYMAGPDKRYNGKEYLLKKEKIEEFYFAFRENFELYLKMKEEGIRKTVQGKMGMTIRFGVIEGVCFGGVYGQIRSEKRLNECLLFLREVQKEM